MKHITHIVSSPDRSIGPYLYSRLDDLVWTARLVRPIVTFLVCGEIVRMAELIRFLSAIVQPILSTIGLTMEQPSAGKSGDHLKTVVFSLIYHVNRTALVQFRGLVELILRFHYCVGQYDRYVCALALDTPIFG